MKQYRNVVFDLDGTLADLTHRLPLIQQSPKNWDEFHLQCINDAPKQNIIAMTHIFYMFHVVHIVSGRNSIVRPQTEKWLARHNVAHNHLWMREANDRRDDAVVKKDLMKLAGLTPSNTLVIFDDRQRVVDMWRSEGFTCCQVAQWKE